MIRTLLKSTAAAIDLVAQPMRRGGVVVLIYHRVGRRTPVEVDLPAELFDEQVGALAATGRVVTLDEALPQLQGHSSASGTESEKPTVVVTFDDGTADFVDVVVPILERHRVPALLYLATEFIDEQRDFPDDGKPASWAGLRDALASGVVSIGSHTHRHRLLDRLPTAEIDDELDRSVDLIGERLGVTAEHFAYPKAVMGSDAADRAVRQRFRSAALAGTRINRYGATDPWRLARSPIQVSDGMRWFEHKARGGMRFEDDVRRLVNRRRYASATT